MAEFTELNRLPEENRVAFAYLCVSFSLIHNCTREQIKIVVEELFFCTDPNSALL